jgi:hypothetical protein
MVGYVKTEQSTAEKHFSHRHHAHEHLRQQINCFNTMSTVSKEAVTLNIGVKPQIQVVEILPELILQSYANK